MLPEIWKTTFNNGVTVPTKIKFCIECTDKTTCDTFNSTVNENKEIEGKLDELKRQPPTNSVICFLLAKINMFLCIMCCLYV